MGSVGDAVSDAVSDFAGGVNDVVGKVTPWNDDSTLGQVANAGLLAAGTYGLGSYLGGAGGLSASSAVPSGAYSSGGLAGMGGAGSITGGLASTAGSGGLLGSIAGGLSDVGGSIGSWWGSLEPQTQLTAGLMGANTLSSMYENQKMRELQKEWMEDTKAEREKHRYSTPDAVAQALSGKIDSDNPGYSSGANMAVDAYLQSNIGGTSNYNAQNNNYKPNSAVDAIVKQPSQMQTWW